MRRPKAREIVGMKRGEKEGEKQERGVLGSVADPLWQQGKVKNEMEKKKKRKKRTKEETK